MALYGFQIHCVLSRLSRVQLFTTPWIAACQAPQFVGFSRQQYWSGLPCPPSGDLTDPEIKPASLESPELAGGFFTTKNFPGGAEVKTSACSVGDLGSIPGLGRSPGEGNGNPLQNSCLENPMDGGAWWATVHGSQRVRHDWATSLHFFTTTATREAPNPLRPGYKLCVPHSNLIYKRSVSSFHELKNKQVTFTKKPERQNLLKLFRVHVS